MALTLEEMARLPPAELSEIPFQEIIAAGERASPEELALVQELTNYRESLNEQHLEYTMQKTRGYNGSHSS